MQFKRNVKLDSDQTKFEVDDTFTFKMRDGEKVKVRAVKEDVNGNMLFIFEDCLKDEYTMSEISNDGVLEGVYNRIPMEIRKLLVTFDNGEYLRLPTEKEIFGVNEYGEEEGEEVEQFECMKNRKHRIAFLGYGTGIWGQYWLANKCRSCASDFTCVGGFGNPRYGDFSNIGGIRLLFLLKNQMSVKNMDSVKGIDTLQVFSF